MVGVHSLASQFARGALVAPEAPVERTEATQSRRQRCPVDAGVVRKPEVLVRRAWLRPVVPRNGPFEVVALKNDVGRHARRDDVLRELPFELVFVKMNECDGKVEVQDFYTHVVFSLNNCSHGASVVHVELRGVGHIPYYGYESGVDTTVSLSRAKFIARDQGVGSNVSRSTR